MLKLNNIIYSYFLQNFLDETTFQFEAYRDFKLFQN